MPTIFRLEGEHLYLDCDEAALHGLSRPFAQADARRCEAWGKGYRDLLSKTTLSEAESAPALLALGRQLRDWLDGDGGWLGRVRPRLAATGPWVVEFAAALPLTAPAKAFIDTPWELVADEQGHWAGDLSVRYSPARRLGGRSTPAAPSEYRLSLVFMAAAPRSQSVLDYEAEEAAILDATGAFGGRAKLDLVVEESGNLGLLADCVAREAPVDVLHLSCHGHSEPTPVLLLESGEGNDEPVGTGNLISALTGNLPRLLFLSACHSARGGAVVDSLAASLLAAGMPAVLGWDGAVRDHEATEFAAVLYRTLSRKAALTEAVANARFELLTQPRTAASPTRDSAQPLRVAARDWHLARLFLGPNGGGPLTAGERRHAGRSRADAGHKEFLDEKGQAVPVAGRREFVGRRRQIQTILHEFRSGDCAGVLVHGMGQQGKSSLAARIANRLDHHATAVVYGRYGPADVLEAFRRAVGGAEVSAIVDRDPERRNDPADFAVRLRELLEGPCYEAVDTQHRPVLLVLDDLERILERRETGLPRVDPAHQAVLGAVIETFANADTDSRLLITSRYQFTLPDHRGRDLAERLRDIPIPPMDETESRKQAGRKVLAREAPPPAEERIERCIQAACGNPGLQDRLFALAAEDPAACDQALAAMERFLQDNVEPDQEQVREFLDNLIIDDLLALLATGERQLLRLSSGFQLPVPWAVFQVLARELALEAGAPAGQRLLALGLWDAFEDAVDSRAVAVAVNGLVGPRLGAVSKDEAAVVAKLTLSPLFTGWGGAAGLRPFILDAELARLAVLCEQAEVLQVTTENGLAWLKGEFQYREAAELARRAVEILDAHPESASLGLLRTAGECCHQVGDMSHAVTYYQRALKLLETAPPPKTPGDIEDRAILLLVYGRLLQSTGNLDEALEYFDKAKALFATGDRFQREQIVVQGGIADILQARGELDEALRIRQEEEIPVYERLGDVRSRAVTMGKIARNAIQQGDYQDAFERLAESYQIFSKLGDLEGIIYAGIDLGQLLCDAGFKKEGIPILNRSREGLLKLGQTDEAEQLQALIDALGGDQSGGAPE